MQSLYDALSEKLAQDPRLTRKGGPRADLGLLLFNARASIQALWVAADALVAAARREGRATPPGLVEAIEQLRPIFGAR